MSLARRTHQRIRTFALCGRSTNPTPPWREDGQSVVEFALVLPVMLLTLFGMMTLGIACNNYMVLTNATNTGARRLSVDRNQSLDPCSDATNAMTAAAPILKSDSLTFAYVINGTSYGSSCSSSSFSTGAAGNMVKNASVTMTVTYPCAIRFFRGTPWANCTLTAQDTEVIQ